MVHGVVYQDASYAIPKAALVKKAIDFPHSPRPIQSFAMSLLGHDSTGSPRWHLVLEAQ